MTPYQFSLVSLRLIAVFFFYQPLMNAIRAPAWFLHAAVFEPASTQMLKDLFYYWTVPFIVPLILAFVVWFVSPWVARLIAGRDTKA